MRVAVVIPNYGLTGGAERFSYELTERIAARPGFEVHVLANRWQGNSTRVVFHKIPSLPFPRFLRPVVFAWSVDKCLGQNKYAIVHTHERIFESDVFTFHGIPHETWIREVRGKSLGLFDRLTAWVEKKGILGSKNNMVLPVSGLVREELLKVYPISEERVRIIYPGVSPEFVAGEHCQDHRAEIRRRHGIQEKDIVVLFVGMNFEVKRLDHVLRGFSIAREKCPIRGLKLLIVGKGKEEKYRAMCSELGIQEYVIFAGVVSDVEKYYFASDIFIMPSQFDTFGLVVLEAMAAGLPVIITNRVGARDLVQDGLNGFVLNGTVSPFQLSEKIGCLLNDEARMKMGTSARKVASRYTWHRTAQEVMELYYELAGRKGLDSIAP